MTQFITNYFFRSPIANSSEEPPSSKKGASKITEAFQNGVASSACTLHSTPSFYQNRKADLGSTSGIGIGLASVLSGLMGSLVEFGYALGFNITHTIGAVENNHFIYQVPPVLNDLIEFFQSGSLSDLGHACQAIFEPKASFYPWGEDTPIGGSMGPTAEVAFDALCGWMPILLLDSAMVISGMHLRNRSPFLGNMLTASGLTAHALYSVDPITVAIDPQDLRHLAANNPDSMGRFIFAMSALTGGSVEAVAAMTATLWVAFVPLVAVAAYMHARSRNVDLVPEGIAIQKWIQKAKQDPKIANELQNLYQTYPRKRDLDQVSTLLLNDYKKSLPKPAELERIQNEISRFVGYLLEKIPASSLDPVKKEIAETWSKKSCTDKIQTGLAAASLFGTISSIAATALSFFANEASSSSLTVAASVFTYISPLFLAASVLSAGYQVYKDFQCSDEQVPRKAKMLSVARFVASVASATLIITALFVPGLNAAFFALLFIGCILNVSLAYARTRMIKKQFEYLQATEPTTWKIMHALWENHQEKPKGTIMSPRLKAWTECVEKKGHHLKKRSPIHPNQREAKINRFKSFPSSLFPKIVPRKLLGQ